MDSKTCSKELRDPFSGLGTRFRIQGLGPEFSRAAKGYMGICSDNVGTFGFRCGRLYKKQRSNQRCLRRPPM